jgi:hypothetical protein
MVKRTWRPGSARGRLTRLLGARLAALAGSALPGERPAHWAPSHCLRVLERAALRSRPFPHLGPFRSPSQRVRQGLPTTSTTGRRRRRSSSSTGRSGRRASRRSRRSPTTPPRAVCASRWRPTPSPAPAPTPAPTSTPTSAPTATSTPPARPSYAKPQGATLTSLKASAAEPAAGSRCVLSHTP